MSHFRLPVTTILNHPMYHTITQYDYSMVSKWFLRNGLGIFWCDAFVVSIFHVHKLIAWLVLLHPDEWVLMVTFYISNGANSLVFMKSTFFEVLFGFTSLLILRLKWADKYIIYIRKYNDNDAITSDYVAVTQLCSKTQIKLWKKCSVKNRFRYYDVVYST